jgi:hypothetical protein
MSILPSWTSLKECKVLQGMYDRLEDAIRRQGNESSDDSLGGMSSVSGLVRMNESTESSSHDSDDDWSNDEFMEYAMMFDMGDFTDSSSSSEESNDSNDDIFLAESDDEDDDDAADDSSLSTVGMIIKEIADEEEVLFATHTRTYDFDTQNEQLIDDLEDTKDTRKVY